MKNNMRELHDTIEIMVNQHRKLKNDLDNVLALSEKVDVDFNEIENILNKFSFDLQEHLHLENDIFYPALLENMREQGADTLKTENFINQMKEIGTILFVFLEKYKDSINIKNHLIDFKRESVDIISELNLRIESEESGVYIYGGL